MNKAELVTAVSEKCELTQKDIEAVVTALFEELQNALASGDKIQLVGFGSFEVRERAARTGRNPKTKEEIHIPATKAPVFKAGKVLKDAVNV